MSLNVEHIDSSQAARSEKAEKPKSPQGEGFAALLATLGSELRSFSGISPEMALPIGAVKPSNLNDAPLPRDAAPDTDRSSAIDDGDRMDDQATGFRPAEDRNRTSSEQSDSREDRDAGMTDRNGPASSGSQQVSATDDGASEMTGATATTVAGNPRTGELQTASAARNAATAQAITGQAGASQAVAEEIGTLAAARQAATPAQSATPAQYGAYKPTGGADGNAIRAIVSDQGAGVASQPNTSLAANATVNAQLGRGNKPATNGQDDGVLLPDDGMIARGDPRPVQGVIKTTTPGAAKASTPDTTAGETAGRPNASPQAAPSPALQAAPAVQAQLANTASSPGAMGQTGQPAPGQIADGGMATSTPSSQSQAPARTRPTAFAGHMRNATQPVPTAEQVAIQIQRAIGNGTDRINIQLRPQELGRVEVKMEVGHDGKLLAVISADKPETLDLLQRDQRSLQDALSNAGLDLDSNSLSFNLNGHDDGQALAGDGGNGSKQGSEDDDQSEDAALAASGHVNVITEDKIDVLL